MTVQEILDDRELVSVPLSVEILIVGGGPTGLGAATRLNQLGRQNWLLVDKAECPGGLSRTDRTAEGFLFDMGGHVIFSHYRYFDELLDAAVGRDESDWMKHERVSYVRLKDRWVPYPLQNNLFCLPDEDKLDCIGGLIDACARKPLRTPPRTFDDWIEMHMGSGIADLFMRPYNFKVWGYPPEQMQCDWLGERVAAVDLKRVVANVIKNKPDEGWGPNASFRFPTVGGTGAIWEKVAALLPKNRTIHGRELAHVDFGSKLATFADGTVCHYDKLILTSPLDSTLVWLGRADLALKLRYSSTHVVGIGIRGISPHDKKCWLYFPESDCPFYRCTIFSLYAPHNCPTTDVCLPTLRRGTRAIIDAANPEPGPYWSLMFEISETELKPVNSSNIVDDAIAGAIKTGLMKNDDDIVSIYYRRLERGYPTPSLERDEAINEGLRILKEKDVWSRGRFGAWKYEVGNQDHSLMQGVEAVDNILFGSPEMTISYPNIVNGQRNEDLKFTLK